MELVDEGLTRGIIITGVEAELRAESAHSLNGVMFEVALAPTDVGGGGGAGGCGCKML